MAAFNSKWKDEKLAVVVHVLYTTQNLVISRLLFCKDDKVHGTCTARAPLLLYSSTTNDRCAKISVEDDETLSIPRIIGFCLCLVSVSSVRTDFDSVTSWAPVYNIYAFFIDENVATPKICRCHITYPHPLIAIAPQQPRQDGRCGELHCG